MFKAPTDAARAVSHVNLHRHRSGEVGKVLGRSAAGRGPQARRACLMGSLPSAPVNVLTDSVGCGGCPGEGREGASVAVTGAARPVQVHALLAGLGVTGLLQEEPMLVSGANEHDQKIRTNRAHENRMARTFVVGVLGGTTPAGPGGYLRWASDVAGVSWCRRDPYAGGLGARSVAASPVRSRCELAYGSWPGLCG